MPRVEVVVSTRNRIKCVPRKLLSHSGGTKKSSYRNGRTMSDEITTAERAYLNLKGLVSSNVEEFWALALGPKKNVLARRMLFRGTVDSCLVHPRDIFRFACESNASSVLVAHNHPSGDLIPSMEDLRFTRQLISAAGLMEIPVLDHLILTSKGYASLRTQGWCRFGDDQTAAVASVHSTFKKPVQLSMNVSVETPELTPPEPPVSLGKAEVGKR